MDLKVVMGLMMSIYDTVMSFVFKSATILILGLDNAGKTVILYCLKLGEPMDYTIPTLGFNVEQVEYKGLTINAWDLGGQTTYRTLWHSYYESANAVVYIIDSADRQRFEESRKELEALMRHPDLSSKPFLIFANKQDLPNAADKQEIINIFKLESFNTQTWTVVPCCAKSNSKIMQGFEWLAQHV